LDLFSADYSIILNVSNAQWIEDPEADFLTLNFINQLVVNATYTVTVSYAGVLPDPTQRGIYYDYYTDAQGVTK
jgi:hypothetical protein